jgi:hypothetical protein
MISLSSIFKKANLELFIWISAIILLGFLNPDSKQLSLCPLHFLGFHYCPGCGLGRSIALVFRGRFAESFAMHPLGFFALLIIGQRIFELAKVALHNARNESVKPEQV